MEKLIEAAIKAKDNAYAKYSNFKVGAALILKNGEIVIGSNIENASYGLSNCAERSALYAAYSKGFRKEDILKIVITTDQLSFVSPCGACRQVMSELMMPSCDVILVNKNKEIKIVKNIDLLPLAFSEGDLNV